MAALGELPEVELNFKLSFRISKIPSSSGFIRFEN